MHEREDHADHDHARDEDHQPRGRIENATRERIVGAHALHRLERRKESEHRGAPSLARGSFRGHGSRLTPRRALSYAHRSFGKLRMESANGEGSERRAPSPSEDRGDDFLYHLYRGSTMLLHDQIVEAKEELERALALQPQDAKSQDLLAGVYFRLGVYPRAIEIWRRLVTTFPREATLRVNLALALFKTGQAQESLTHLHEALRTQPEHERAWGYLGLVHWRLGRFVEARDAFLRGGQAAMARRMEAELQRQGGGEELTHEVAEAALEAKDRAAMRTVAEEALERLDSERPHLAVELGVGERAARRKPTGTWKLDEPGSDFVPPRVAPAPAPAPEEPPMLRSKLDGWSAEPPTDVPLSIARDGSLVLRAEREVHARLDGLVAVRGELRTTVVRRRARGRELDEALGGRDPILAWRGPVAALLAPATGRRFVAMRLGAEALFVRETLLFGFDERVSFENANLPLAGTPVGVVQLHGDGVVVLALGSEPLAMAVREGEELHVDPARLVGWSGRLFPSGRRGTAPYAAHAPALGFRGEGIVLLGEATEVR